MWPLGGRGDGTGSQVYATCVEGLGCVLGFDAQEGTGIEDEPVCRDFSPFSLLLKQF